MPFSYVFQATRSTLAAATSVSGEATLKYGSNFVPVFRSVRCAASGTVTSTVAMASSVRCASDIWPRRSVDDGSRKTDSCRRMYETVGWGVGPTQFIHGVEERARLLSVSGRCVGPMLLER